MIAFRLVPHALDHARQVIEIIDDDGALLGAITQSEDGLHVFSKYRLTVTPLPDDPLIRTADGRVVHAVAVRIEREGA